MGARLVDLREPQIAAPLQLVRRQVKLEGRRRDGIDGLGAGRELRLQALGRLDLRIAVDAGGAGRIVAVEEGRRGRVDRGPRPVSRRRWRPRRPAPSARAPPRPGSSPHAPSPYPVRAARSGCAGPPRKSPHGPPRASSRATSLPPPPDPGDRRRAPAATPPRPRGGPSLDCHACVTVRSSATRTLRCATRHTTARSEPTPRPGRRRPARRGRPSLPAPSGPAPTVRPAAGQPPANPPVSPSRPTRREMFLPHAGPGGPSRCRLLGRGGGVGLEDAMPAGRAHRTAPGGDDGHHAASCGSAPGDEGAGRRMSEGQSRSAGQRSVRRSAAKSARQIVTRPLASRAKNFASRTK